MRKLLLGTCLVACAVSFSVSAAEHNLQSKNTYLQTVFVANQAKYSPTLQVEKDMLNAWGIAIRPKGAGGHFWVTAKDASYEYVGDVTNSGDENLKKIHQDALKIVKLPVGGDDKFATGTVFSDSKDKFVITQTVANGESIKAPAKFLFASDGGVISAWTEKKNDDGSFERSGEAVAVVDQSKEGSQFFGLAISSNYDLIYAADFGAKPGIKVFDGEFKQVDMKFDNPFDSNKNGQVDAGEYAPFNVQAMQNPAGEKHILVAYVKTQACPSEEIKKGTCAKGEIFAGEEDTSKPGYGRIAEFSESGKLINIWKDGGKLNAPWGVAYSPSDFGALSNKLLVGNFGDGTIAAFDPYTHEFVDYLRDAKGKPVKIDKVWGLLFGNGESLGDANSLYFAAGPDDEKDGIFGKLSYIKSEKSK